MRWAFLFLAEWKNDCGQLDWVDGWKFLAG
jgi:hypothetical protein